MSNRPFRFKLLKRKHFYHIFGFDRLIWNHCYKLFKALKKNTKVTKW